MKRQLAFIFLVLFPTLALCEPGAPVPAPTTDKNQNKGGLLEAREAQSKAAFNAQQQKNLLAAMRRNLVRSLRKGDTEGAAVWAEQIRITEIGVAAVPKPPTNPKPSTVRTQPVVSEPPIEPNKKITPNGYGLGVNRDQFGAAHVYRTEDGKKLNPIFQGNVKRDAYGLGVHADEFGRRVYDGKP